MQICNIAPLTAAWWKGPQTVLSVVANVVSVVRVWWARHSWEINATNAIKRILAFVSTNGSWRIRNVGQVPAMNVTFYELVDSAGVHLMKHKVILYPISLDEELVLNPAEFDAPDVLMANYSNSTTDLYGSQMRANAFSSKSGHVRLQQKVADIHEKWAMKASITRMKR